MTNTTVRTIEVPPGFGRRDIEAELAEAEVLEDWFVQDKGNRGLGVWFYRPAKVAAVIRLPLSE